MAERCLGNQGRFKLTGNDSELLLEGEEVPAGDYAWIRLMINPEGTFLREVGGGEFRLNIPSGDKTGLKLVSGFSVEENGSANFTIDFDLRKAVNKKGAPACAANPDDCCKLRPALRLIQNDEAGSLEGSVDADLLVDGICQEAGVGEPDGQAVYVYEGDVIPDDIFVADGAPVEHVNPVSEAPVLLDVDSGDCVYEVGFLEAGDYTVTFVPNGAEDDPELDDETIEFVQSTLVSVTAGEETEHDFEFEPPE